MLEKEIQTHFRQEPLIRDEDETRREQNFETLGGKSLTRSREERRSSVTQIAVPHSTLSSTSLTSIADGFRRWIKGLTFNSIISNRKRLLLATGTIGMIVIFLIFLLKRRTTPSLSSLSSSSSSSSLSLPQPPTSAPSARRASRSGRFADLMDLLDSAFSVDYNTRRRRQLRRVN